MFVDVCDGGFLQPFLWGGGLPRSLSKCANGKGPPPPPGDYSRAVTIQGRLLFKGRGSGLQYRHDRSMAEDLRLLCIGQRRRISRCGRRVLGGVE